MVIWVKFTRSSPFTLLIPRMSTFTLVISCLTTYYLPWFMDLTFQVPMQYCSLQHQTLLLSPVTPTTGCCFCFGSVSSFFLELFLHWSPVAFWAPTNLGSSSFSFLFAFSYCSWGSQGKNTEVVCHSPEKAMAPHSSILAWKIPWTEEPGRLQSMRSQRVGHDWVTSLHFTSTV